MANNKEEAGKGTPRPGEMPAAKRPYATIDLRASEVEGRDPPAGTGASKPVASAPGQEKSAAKPDSKPDSKPSDPKAKTTTGPSAPADPKEGKAPTGLPSLATRRRAARLITHLAAGAVGAILVLAAVRLITPDQPPPARAPEVNDLQRRLADIESVLGTRPNAGLRARLDEMGRSLSTLGEAQAKLSRETKTLESKVGSGQEIPQELVGRLARLEEMLSSAPAGDPAAQSPQLTALAARLAELQKAAKEAGDAARSGITRFDS